MGGAEDQDDPSEPEPEPVAAVEPNPPVSDAADSGEVVSVVASPAAAASASEPEVASAEGGEEAEEAEEDDQEDDAPTMQGDSDHVASQAASDRHSPVTSTPPRPMDVIHPISEANGRRRRLQSRGYRGPQLSRLVLPNRSYATVKADRRRALPPTSTSQNNLGPTVTPLQRVQVVPTARRARRLKYRYSWHYSCRVSLVLVDDSRCIVFISHHRYLYMQRYEIVELLISASDLGDWACGGDYCGYPLELRPSSSGLRSCAEVGGTAVIRVEARGGLTTTKEVLLNASA